jgi:hypothetical protein
MVNFLVAVLVLSSPSGRAGSGDCRFQSRGSIPDFDVSLEAFLPGMELIQSIRF